MYKYVGTRGTRKAINPSQIYPSLAKPRDLRLVYSSCKVIASGCEAIQIEIDHHDDSSSDGFTQALPEALDKLIMAADLRRPDRARAREVLARNAYIFSLSKYNLDRTKMTPHDIPLVAGAHPI